MMKLRIIIFYILFPFLLIAQELTPEELKQQGETYFSYQKYPEALISLQRYHALQGAEDDILLKIGKAAYEANQLRLAKKTLEDLLKKEKGAEEELFLYLGKTLHLQEDFKQAAVYYKKFLMTAKDKHPLRAQAKDAIRSCGVGIRLSVPNKAVIVESLGEKVNSEGDDFAPILSPNYQDRLYFSSLRKGNTGGLRNEEGIISAIGKYKADMYKTYVVNGEWAVTEPNEPFLNSPQHDVILDFNTDGSVMYFSKSSNLYSGETFVDTFANRDNRTLFPPAFSSPMIMENGDGTPFFFQDTLMLFSSRRAGGFGGLDLYFTVFTNGNWTSPQNLGAAVNSAYDESTPFLAQDGKTLYFSSNDSHKSIGGYDIFKSVFDVEKEAWGEVQNLGLPINAARDDTHFRLSKDGFKAYFASQRQDALGARDLYSVYFQSPQKEQLLTDNVRSFQEFLIVEETENKVETTIVAETPSINTAAPQEIKNLELESLFYQDDNDVLNARNTKKLKKIINALKRYPSLKVGLTCHSAKAASLKFDLYFSIKRLDKVVDYMMKNGVEEEQILMKGVGSTYPIARNEFNNRPNLIGQSLNKRIDFQIFNINDLAIEITTVPIQVNPNIAVTDHKFFTNASKELSYKIQIAAIKQMYQSDLILNYPNPMIEKFADSDLYHYTVGLYQTYTAAEQLRQDLVKNGVTNAFVVPYLNGIRLKKEEIEPISTTYPDLEQYLSTKLKD